MTWRRFDLKYWEMVQVRSEVVVDDEDDESEAIRVELRGDRMRQV